MARNPESATAALAATFGVDEKEIGKRWNISDGNLADQLGRTAAASAALGGKDLYASDATEALEAIQEIDWTIQTVDTKANAALFYLRELARLGVDVVVRGPNG